MIQKRTKINLFKILQALKEHGSLHIRGLHRVTGINPLTVSTIIKRYERFFNIDNREVIPGFGTKIVSLRNQDITVDDIEKDIELRRSIRRVPKAKLKTKLVGHSIE